MASLFELKQYHYIMFFSILFPANQYNKLNLKKNHNTVMWNNNETIGSLLIIPIQTTCNKSKNFWNWFLNMKYIIIDENAMFVIQNSVSMVTSTFYNLKKKTHGSWFEIKHLTWYY